MPDTDPKRRMISLRLSEVEYEVLRAHYRDCGARNISDLARLALQRILNGSTASPNDLAAKVLGLEGRVRTLESQVSLLEREKVMS